MGWKIIFAPQALEELEQLEQLEQIVRFIAQDEPQAAIRFGDYLVDRAESLTNFPELGMPYRKQANVRRLLCSRITSTIVPIERSRRSRSWITGTPLVANLKYDVRALRLLAQHSSRTEKITKSDSKNTR